MTEMMTTKRTYPPPKASSSSESLILTKVAKGAMTMTLKIGQTAIESQKFIETFMGYSS